MKRQHPFRILGVLARRGAAAAAMLTAAVSGATAGPFNATYVVHMSVDAAQANPQNPADRALVQGAAMLGWFEVGTIVDSGSLDRDRFKLRSVGTGSRELKTLITDNRLETDRSSEAQIRQGNLVTLRFSDKRGSSPLLTYAADLARKRYEIRRGDKVTEAGTLRGATVDIAALPYLYLGRKPPTAPFEIAYTDGKSIKAASFQVAAETLAIAGSSVATTRLTSAPRGPKEPLIEIWLRQADAFPLRVRVGMSSHYGAVADQQIKALPPIYTPGG